MGVALVWSRNTLVVTCFLAGWGFPDSMSGALAQEDSDGRANLILTYKCPAETRAAFRDYMEKSGVHAFDAWKREGVFDDYLILFSSFAYGDPAVPDMMVRLDFATYTDVGKWKEIERTRPAGLSNEATRMCRPLTSDLADLKWHSGRNDRTNRADAVYIMVPVHFKVLDTEYANYFEGYVKPQYDGWVEAGALTWWGGYMNHLRQGDVWDLLILYEYAGLTGIARRDVVKQEVRKKLQESHEWLAMHQDKLDVRLFRRAVPMDAILAAQPE